jgi:uncharacterized membrane protein YadS
VIQGLEEKTEQRIIIVQVVGTVLAIAIPLTYTIQFAINYPRIIDHNDILINDIIEFWNKFLLELGIESVIISVMLLITTCYFTKLINKLFTSEHFILQR